jgi:hypothetical protein
MFYVCLVPKMDLAVLIIGYARPEGISYLLQTVVSAGISKVYLAIDGPKNDSDKVRHEKITTKILNFQSDPRITLHVLNRVNNLGVAGGVLNSIDWFFSHEKMGLIIEDDLIVSKDFFDFSLQALKKYKDDSSVWMISGTQIFPNSNQPAQVEWTNYPMIWGWAGWADKWKLMRKSLLAKKQIGLPKLLDSRYLYWAVGANRALSGKVDTWDTPLAFEFIKQGKLCLLPPVNLVSNTGNDAVSTNTKLLNNTMNLEIKNIGINCVLMVKPNQLFVKRYNSLLEKNVFKIKKRHILLPYYSFVFDFIRFPRQKRRQPLNERTDWAKI